MAFKTKRQLRIENSELKAKLEVYEVALANAGLSALKLKKKPVEKEEFGFCVRKKSKK